MSRNIFAIEGEWENSIRDRTSVKHGLLFLEETMGIETIFRKVGTEEGLYHYLKKAQQSNYSDFGIIYLAFHGSTDGITISDGRKRPLSIIKIAEDFPDCFSGKIIHFGSCSILKKDSDELEQFKKITGAVLVSGYTKDIDFFDSTILDMAWFNLLQSYERLKTAPRNKLEKTHPVLCKELGFVAF